MDSKNSLRKNSLGLWTIVFFVVAAASPLTGVVGALPLNFAFGNGAGVPGSFIVTAILLILFSFGFVAMSKHIVNAGAFYTYIVQGLGVSSGISGLSVAVITYLAMQISVTALFGLFSSLLIKSYFHIDLPWWLYALVMQVVVMLLGIARVEIGGKILGLLMILEVAIILVIDISIFTHPIEIEFSSFQPSVIFTQPFGISMIFAVASFIGFEAAAIYSEECIDSKKVISKATFIAVILIAGFFILTSWAFVLYSTPTQVATIAMNDPENFVYNIATNVLGKWSTDFMALLLVTSLFAATQAFHNSLSRYIYTISRDGLFWSKLSETHPRYQTPYIASFVQGAFLILLIILFAIIQLDPIVDIFAWCSALGSMSILVLQMAVSVAVICFFIKNKNLPVSFWSKLLAPAISSIGMLCVLYLVIAHLDILSGSNSPAIYSLPISLLLIIILAFLYGLMLKHKNASLYKKISNLVKTI